MKKQNDSLEDITKKILKGLELVSVRLIEKTRKEKGELVVMQGDKIVRIKP